MKIFKSCSVVLGGCLLAPMLSGCLGGLLGNSQPQETPNQILQKKRQEWQQSRKVQEAKQRQQARQSLQAQRQSIQTQLAYERATSYLANPNQTGYEDYSYDKALTDLQEAIKGGNADALVALGDMYFSAQGVAQDDAKAFDYYTQAANKKVVGAYARLAHMYAFGAGTKQDTKKALEYANLAIQGQNMPAHLTLAIMYINGIGVPENGDKAREHLNIACKGNVKQACQVLDVIGQ
ncbi:tetratricopeptide repeat protein [Helicobacter vulpis]|uniref:tetratricopeptide repeat protein n=1 Tax=Helicobacter vulpis TaxID=2316076 RepID=UPI000EACC779|nr:tetratricopeptide repeat protein [Helicobacter vulpis]